MQTVFVDVGEEGLLTDPVGASDKRVANRQNIELALFSPHLPFEVANCEERQDCDDHIQLGFFLKETFAFCLSFSSSWTTFGFCATGPAVAAYDMAASHRWMTSRLSRSTVTVIGQDVRGLGDPVIEFWIRERPVFISVLAFSFPFQICYQRKPDSSLSVDDALYHQMWMGFICYFHFLFCCSIIIIIIIIIFMFMFRSSNGAHGVYRIASRAATCSSATRPRSPADCRRERHVTSCDFISGSGSCRCGGRSGGGRRSSRSSAGRRSRSIVWRGRTIRRSFTARHSATATSTSATPALCKYWFTSFYPPPLSYPDWLVSIPPATTVAATDCPWTWWAMSVCVRVCSAVTSFRIPHRPSPFLWIGCVRRRVATVFIISLSNNWRNWVTRRALRHYPLPYQIGIFNENGLINEKKKTFKRRWAEVEMSVEWFQSRLLLYVASSSSSLTYWFI